MNVRKKILSFSEVQLAFGNVKSDASKMAVPLTKAFNKRTSRARGIEAGLVLAEFIHETRLVSMLMTRRILCGYLGNEGMERMGCLAIDYVAAG